MPSKSLKTPSGKTAAGLNARNFFHYICSLNVTRYPFNFNMFQPYAIMQLSIVLSIIICFSKIDYDMYKVLLQNTFQSSMPC